MNTLRRSLVLAASMVLVMSMVATTSASAPPRDDEGSTATVGTADYIPSPQTERQNALKQKAQEMVLAGEVTPTGDNKVVKVAKGQFVELAFEGEDQILTLLAEFGDADPTHNHGAALGNITHTGDGYTHNSIPEPDRTVDNSTIWQPDFSQAYYDNLLYNKGKNPSMANWYLEQSSGRYSVDGAVGDWVTVPNNPAAYGSNYCGSIVCTRDIGRFVEDQADTWWTQLVAKQGSEAAANAFLATFDIWDRYDFDGDGNFDEPDGYIDHFQSVHASEGEETGGGALGENAIWSHRSFVNSIPFGADGPSPGGVLNAFGGARIGTSNYWIGDYTIEPENGGVGVFAHEFAHDLNIPDLYDTSGNTGGAENGTAWWTVMSQGSYGSVNGTDLGSAPTHFGAWEKFQLGWLNYEVGRTGQNRSFRLGPAATNTKQAQGLFVVLPPKEVSTFVGDPFEGEFFYHSGSGNDLDNTMTRPITLGATPGNLSFQARYHIEPCWDYAYVQVSTDGGSTWTNLDTSASTDDNTNGQNFGNGITGISGTPLVCDDDLSPVPVWTNVTADLSAYANSTIQLRFRYWTDVAAVGDGMAIDNILIDGALDGGETDPGWTFDGWTRTTGTITTLFNHFYLAEFRQYRGYDTALKVGPYNFVDAESPTIGNLVEHFPYQDGLLVSYWDTSQADNNVGDHPGEGLILPIDANPGTLHWSDGSTARPRIQSYDATFGLWATDPLSLNLPGLTLNAPSRPAVSVFNDTNSYWVNGDPGDAPADGRYQSEWNSVNVPQTGTTIEVVSVGGKGSFMQVHVK